MTRSEPFRLSDARHGLCFRAAPPRRRSSAPAIGTLLVAIATALHVAPAQADINLEFRPAFQTVNVGDTINLGFYAVSDDPVQDQCFSAIQAICTWDIQFAQLIGLDGTGGVPLIISGFPPDPHGLNESDPPQDGDGMYIAWAPLGQGIWVTPAGTLITTFQFEALAATPGTPVELLFTGGDPLGESKVFDCVIPNFNILGTLAGAIVQIIDPSACPEDINADGAVDVLDLLLLLAAWGGAGGPEDINGDGIVNVEDLLQLLAAWGACP